MYMSSGQLPSVGALHGIIITETHERLLQAKKPGGELGSAETETALAH